MIVAYILIFFIALISGYSLFKIRKIHLLLFELKDSIQHLSEVKLQDQLKQIQCLARLEKNLNITPGTLPPAWGWTALPDVLEIIQEEASKPEVKNCFECGSGLSTIITALCLQKKGEGKVLSLEHSKDAKAATDKELKKLGLSNFAEVIYAPLKEYTFNGRQQLWYNLDNFKSKIPNKVNLLFVDGPPVNTSKLARYPALAALKENLSDSALVILDDGIRKDEQEIANLWEKEFEGMERVFNLTERKAIVFRRG